VIVVTLDFFYDNYDLKNSEIKSALIKDNKLIINVNVVAHLELIANGYRPELDVNHEIEFTFDYVGNDKIYKNPVVEDVKFNDSKLNITLNGDSIVISNNYVNVKQNR